MRFFAIAGVALVFVGWIFYRLLIKRDLRKEKNMDILKFGIFFFGVWALIYLGIMWM